MFLISARKDGLTLRHGSRKNGNYQQGINQSWCEENCERFERTTTYLLLFEQIGYLETTGGGRNLLKKYLAGKLYYGIPVLWSKLIFYNIHGYPVYHLWHFLFVMLWPSPKFFCFFK